MYLVGKIESTLPRLGEYLGKSEGYERRPLVGTATGATSHGAAVSYLAPGGRVLRHAHESDEAFFVMSGALTVEAGGRVERVGTNGYGLICKGSAHSLRNDSVDVPCRWFEVSAAKTSAARADAHFSVTLPRETPASTELFVGHFGESDLPRPRAAKGLFLSLGGAALKRLISSACGATGLDLVLVQYEPGGFITPHYHAIEESFLFLSGEVDVELDGDRHTMRAGDFFWIAPGAVHALENRTPAPVRWLEAQAPQPSTWGELRFRASRLFRRGHA